jgi:hypothetical protein
MELEASFMERGIGKDRHETLSRIVIELLEDASFLFRFEMSHFREGADDKILLPME